MTSIVETSNVTTVTVHPESWTEADYSPGDTESDGGVIDPSVIIQKVYLSIGIFGMIDNFFVAVVLVTSKELRARTTNMFIINQSIIDFTVSFCIVLTNYFRDMTTISSSLGRELFCRFWLTNLGIWGFYFSSSYNLIAMTVERYFGLVHPLSHSVKLAKWKLIVVFVFVWIFGVGLHMSLTAPTSYRPTPDTCSVASNFSKPVWRKVTAIAYGVIAYFLPLTIILYCYTRIMITLKKSCKGNNSQSNMSTSANHDQRISKARKNVIKTVAIMCICFIFFWSWNTVYIMLYFWGVKLSLNTPFYHFTVVAVFANSCINPIVYAVKYEEFQGRVIYLCCFKMRTEKEKESNEATTSTAQI